MTKKNTKKISRWSFWVCLIVSIALMVGGAITPPPFVIDATIFKAVGWLFGFAALGQLPDILHSDKAAKIKHGDTTVTIGYKNDEETENELLND